MPPMSDLRGTARWRLREWEEKDAARLLTIVQEAGDLERQLPSLPASEVEAARLIRSTLLSRPEVWVWCLEHDGAAVGSVRCEIVPENLHGEAARHGSGRGWVSYWSAREIRGTGMLSEAVRDCCDWALNPQGGGLRRLELGYRENNPASAAVAHRAGFQREGREREKFVVDGVPVDVLTAARLASEDPFSSAGPVRCRGSRLHHLELWTGDFEGTIDSWRWLLQRLDAVRLQSWTQGESWLLSPAQDGDAGAGPAAPGYLVIEQSPDVLSSGGVQRHRPGMNHLALVVRNRRQLDLLRDSAGQHGWRELFSTAYPHAGGRDHTALYLENAEGFEVELVLA